jgi:flagellar motor switch protein FliN/FliY
MSDQTNKAAATAAAAPTAGAASAAKAPERARFDDLAANAAKTGNGSEVSLDMILDVPVTLSLEVGSASMSVRDLLQLNQGSVVELDRLAGEPMDVLVNGTLVAHGEVVVVNDKFGIRLTDIVSPAQRVSRLN